MFGLSIVRTKKLNSLFENASRISLDNKTVNKRLINILALIMATEAEYQKTTQMDRSKLIKEQKYGSLLRRFFEDVKDL